MKIRKNKKQKNPSTKARENFFPAAGSRKMGQKAKGGGWGEGSNQRPVGTKTLNRPR